MRMASHLTHLAVIPWSSATLKWAVIDGAAHAPHMHAAFYCSDHVGESP